LKPSGVVFASKTGIGAPMAESMNQI